jgi:ABC-type oligopeptide transport system substrate-binding subunit/DNA-binding SARP family transcriptional activator
MSHLALYLLGSPRLELAGQRLEINRRKAIALMAYLAVTGQAHSRDALATLLWPDFDQSRARGALRRTLSTLNTALGGDWLAADRETIALEPAGELWLDVAVFQQYLAAYRSPDHGPPELSSDRLSDLTEAAALYSDDFLAGFTLRASPAFDEWQFFQAENLRRDLAWALEQLVQAHSRQGDYDLAIGHARRWLRLDPLDESVHRYLMRLYVWNDQRPAALRQYQECVRILADELAAAPSQETSTLYEQIRTGQFDQATAGPTLDQPETPAATLTDSDPSLISPKPAPSFIEQLPEPMVDESPVFVAREAELAQLDGALQRMLAGHGQVVLITGEAGSGKSALVRECARRAQTASAELVVAVGHCNAHIGLGDPYLPFREMFGLLTGDLEAGWVQGVVTRENARRVWALLPVSIQTLVDLGPNLLDTFVPYAGLSARAAAHALDLSGLRPADERQPNGNGSTGRARNDLFEQYTNVLRHLAGVRPLLLVVEDAHWADVASISLMFHLGRRLAGARLLLVITQRPGEIAQGRPPAQPVGGHQAVSTLLVGAGQTDRHPLEAVIYEFERLYGDIRIDLDQAVDPQFVEAILKSEPNRLAQAFSAALQRQTQGHPLFTIELLRDMQARGDLVRDEQGYWIEGPTLNWETLPPRVEAVIRERVARLDDELYELLTTASVEGEEFTAQVIAHVHNIPERQLLRQLSQELDTRHRLIREQGEVQVGRQFLQRYQFGHALFQQFLYSSLSPGERRLLHGEIARALETLFQPQTEAIIVKLAHHYTAAGQGEPATTYLLQAGDQARSVYAYEEAIEHYQKALVFLREQKAYERAARTLMKLGLTAHLIFDFKQARRAYEEGFVLWQRAGRLEFSNPLPPAPHPLRLLWNEPSSLDPTMAMDSTSGSIIDQIFSGLVELSPESEVMPGLAERWEVLAEGCKYRFHLRPDLVWSDGVPLTAADLVYAWQRVLNPATDSPNAPLLYDVRGAKAFHQGQIQDPNTIGVRALDALTLEIELEGPTSYFPLLLTHTAMVPVPGHIIETHGDAWTQPKNIVSNGPFKLVEWQHHQSVILERNPDYRGRFTGNVQRVDITLDAGEANELPLYEAGDLDVASLWYLVTPDAELVQQRHADEYLAGPGLHTRYIAFDVTRPPFDDVRVRQALAMVIDRETLFETVYNGYLFPATGGVVPPGMFGHSVGIALPYDPQQARTLLAEAGYPGGRDFPEVDWLAKTSNKPLVDYLQTQWREQLGLTIARLEKEEFSFYAQLDETSPHMAQVGWSADYPDPDSFLRASSILATTGWRNPAYERLVEEARRVIDQAERANLYRQADRMLIEAVVVIPLYYSRRHELVKPWVSRFPISPIKIWFCKDVVIEPH